MALETEASGAVEATVGVPPFAVSSSWSNLSLISSSVVESDRSIDRMYRAFGPARHVRGLGSSAPHGRAGGTPMTPFEIGMMSFGVMILLGVHHMIEAWAVQNLPYWLQDLAVSL